MHRTHLALVTSLALLAGLAVPVLANPLILLGPVLPSPGDVVKLIDSLTKNDSSTTVDVKMGKTTSQGKLLVARTRVDVGMDRSSRNWRGKVIVHVNVPTEVTFSIDLGEIRPEHIRLDSQKRRLIVAMPTPRVEDVTPLLPEVKAENSYKSGRFKFMDVHTSRELQNAMLLHDYQAKARTVATKSVPRVREQSRAAFQQFLQKLLQGTAPDVQVVVE